jgi:hypothetical protein
VCSSDLDLAVLGQLLQLVDIFHVPTAAFAKNAAPFPVRILFYATNDQALQ